MRVARNLFIRRARGIEVKICEERSLVRVVLEEWNSAEWDVEQEGLPSAAVCAESLDTRYEALVDAGVDVERYHQKDRQRELSRPLQPLLQKFRWLNPIASAASSKVQGRPKLGFADGNVAPVFAYSGQLQRPRINLIM